MIMGDCNMDDAATASILGINQLDLNNESRPSASISQSVLSKLQHYDLQGL